MTLSESPESQINDPIFDKYEDDPGYLSSEDTCATPISEMSPSESPWAKAAASNLDMSYVNKDRAHKLAASLSLEEQVYITSQSHLHFNNMG